MCARPAGLLSKDVADAESLQIQVPGGDSHLRVTKEINTSGLEIYQAENS